MEFFRKIVVVTGDAQGIGKNICIDGGMTRLMIYHNDNGWKMGL